MIFDLTVMSFGKEAKIQFDNQTNIFSDPCSGENLLADSKCIGYIRFPKLYKINKNDIGVLFINLGLNCNFSCKYCHQNSFRTSTNVENCTPTKAKHLIRILSEAKIHPRALSFWGGEPLVYWKSLVVLIPELRKLYPGVTINFPTNGALLNEERIKFLKSYNVGFYISYDGKQTNRDVSVFDIKEIKTYFQETHDPVNIMPTQNKSSMPIIEIYDEFKQMKIDLKSISAYSIARCNPWNRSQAKEIYIPDEKIKEYSDFICRVLRKEEKHERLYGGIQSRFDHIAKIFYYGMGIDSAEVSYCGNMTGRDVCIDCNGTVFNCMNIPLFSFGNIKDDIEFDLGSIYHPFYEKEECMNCPYVTPCRGGCPLISSDQSDEFKVNCHNLKGLAIPFFRMVVENLLGVYLKKIVRVSDGKVFGEW